MMFIKRNEEETMDPQENKIVRFASKHFSVTPNFIGDHFFHNIDGKRFITPLFLVLLMIERSEEHTSELQSLMRISYAVFCLKKKKNKDKIHNKHKSQYILK